MSETPQRNITVVTGDQFVDTLEFDDDRTGNTFRAQIRSLAASTGTPDAQFGCSISSHSDSTSTLTITLSSASTSVLTSTNPRDHRAAYPGHHRWWPGYRWDVKQTTPSGVPTTLLRGTVEVIQNVTKGT